MPPNLTRNNKKKIFNDPVYGFISIPGDFLFDLIEHPYVQRLRRIKQLGMTHLVYPGALHTRFHHVLGAMHLMSKAVSTLRRKGVEITLEEEEAVLAAILLHDIGHGPFSHALEHDIVNGISHEEISELFMTRLNETFNQKLSLTLKIFENSYKKPFLHQLVSSQLDMDRMDYLNRDSFYTGVSEGVIGSERIIEMLNVINNELVLEEKGIYSVEKFLVARRLMYWQVYLHKTVVSSEFMLINVLRRAKELCSMNKKLFASPALSFFLENNIQKSDFETKPELLDQFAKLDDFDIMSSVKVWQEHEDYTLSTLSKAIVNRRLLKIKIAKKPFSTQEIENIRTRVLNKTAIPKDQIQYFVFSNVLTNNAYNDHLENINMILKNGETLDISLASDNLNISALSQPVQKFFLCYPECFE